MADTIKAIRFYVTHGSKPKSNKRWAVTKETIYADRALHHDSEIVADGLTQEEATTERARLNREQGKVAVPESDPAPEAPALNLVPGLSYTHYRFKGETHENTSYPRMDANRCLSGPDAEGYYTMMRQGGPLHGQRWRITAAGYNAQIAPGFVSVHDFRNTTSEGDRFGSRATASEVAALVGCRADQVTGAAPDPAPLAPDDAPGDRVVLGRSYPLNCLRVTVGGTDACPTCGLCLPDGTCPDCAPTDADRVEILRSANDVLASVVEDCKRDACHAVMQIEDGNDPALVLSGDNIARWIVAANPSTAHEYSRRLHGRIAIGQFLDYLQSRGMVIAERTKEYGGYRPLTEVLSATEIMEAFIRGE